MTLIPPDPEQCQSFKSNDVNFMTLGGQRKMERCTNAPTVIAFETIPGPDGLMGSMSLCEECREQALKQFSDLKIIPVSEYKATP